MMKKPASFRAFAIGAAVLTALAALLRSLAFATSFDREVGYFDSNVFSTSLYIVIALVLIDVACFAWIARRAPAVRIPCPVRNDRSVMVKIGSWLVV